MNYFQLHLGDWAQGVAHLSLLEEGVYLRLLRRYYAEEKPLPSDIAACQRLAGARSQDEREAVAVVLQEFFALTDEGYRNKRADQEIAKFHEGEPEREAKKANERERQQRTREERRRLFDELRERGIVPAYDTTTTELRRLLSQPVTRDVTRTNDVSARDDTATHTQEPVTINQEPEKQKHERVPRSLGRFEDFWQAYPNKKGRKDAEKAWARKGLDAQADLIIADVRRRQVHDRDWVKGYVPHGSTYVNAEGWRDGLPPVPLPQTPQMQPSRQMQAIQNILGVTHENDDTSRVVLDINPAGAGADVRQLPARLPGC